MALTFYPHSDDAQKGSIVERLETLMEAAERYKAIVLDLAAKGEVSPNQRLTPRDMVAAYNWEEIANILRQIREITEANKADKIKKAEYLVKLAEIYEVLRAAKMPKLEAVRLALTNEANQLKGSAQVA